MIERGYGRIINVASLAALVPAPAGHTLYAASKAFVVKFSEALAGEVRSAGIHVTALCRVYAQRVSRCDRHARHRQRVAGLVVDGRTIGRPTGVRRGHAGHAHPCDRRRKSNDRVARPLGATAHPCRNRPPHRAAVSQELTPG